jgi:hypothetical protein
MPALQAQSPKFKLSHSHQKENKKALKKMIIHGHRLLCGTAVILMEVYTDGRNFHGGGESSGKL